MSRGELFRSPLPALTILPPEVFLNGLCSYAGLKRSLKPSAQIFEYRRDLVAVTGSLPAVGR